MHSDRPHFEPAQVADWLEHLRRGRFFGTVTVGIQNGECCTIETKFVSKPGDVLPVITRKA